MDIRDWVIDLRERVQRETIECQELTEEMVWGRVGPLLWRTSKTAMAPAFYPVYRFEDYYSFSLLALVLKKGALRLNARATSAAADADFLYSAGNDTIDLDVHRVGGPHPIGRSIREVDEFADRIAQALRSDTAAVEARHPGFTNVILCGGKDSLNLLLLPWTNPTEVFSAEPNYEHVCDFVARNELPYRVRRLDDPSDPNTQNQESLLACCRVDLAHWRWGGALKEIARAHDQRAIFWKGQVADLYTTPKWKAFAAPARKWELYPRKAYRKFASYLPAPVDIAVGRLLHRRVVRATWDRCAVLQGAHVAFLRELTGSLFLSAYHGTEMLKVWSEADLARVARIDMRSLIGLRLLGRQVLYPTQNPAPAPSIFRSELGRPKLFLDLLNRAGIPVIR